MTQTDYERSIAVFKFELSHLFFIADENAKQNFYWSVVQRCQRFHALSCRIQDSKNNLKKVVYK